MAFNIAFGSMTDKEEGKQFKARGSRFEPIIWWDAPRNTSRKRHFLENVSNELEVFFSLTCTLNFRLLLALQLGQLNWLNYSSLCILYAYYLHTQYVQLPSFADSLFCGVDLACTSTTINSGKTGNMICLQITLFVI